MSPCHYQKFLLGCWGLAVREGRQIEERAAVVGRWIGKGWVPWVGECVLTDPFLFQLL